ncbi:hypothetical protein ACFPC0_16015 [Streptomyces andamanensis]|uniref:Uncharacterized protein n=1 Tax=Streptomyces andamanensis TaxID=1565035 RepID=A0ABV8TF47_9ACTN
MSVDDREETGPRARTEDVSLLGTLVGQDVTARAQILTAWRPGLPVGHTPAHFTPYASRAPRPPDASRVPGARTR